jgi:hypothetical protein
VLGKITSGGKYAEPGSARGRRFADRNRVLFDDVDVTDGDVEVTIIAREAEVRASDLLYEATVDTDNEKATKATQLAAVGIIVRS